MKISLSDLEDGMTFSNDLEAMVCYVNTETGAQYYQTEGTIEEEPADLYSNSAWVKIPGKHHFDLGKSLYYAFIEQYCPEQYDSLRSRLNRRGGYRAMKDYFEEHDLLDRFYEFESAAAKRALREWAKDEKIEIDEK